MNKREFEGTIGYVDGVEGGAGVLKGIEAAHRKATQTWDGYVSAHQMRAAQKAAMELSLIVAGGLHVLGRAPVGELFGLLARTIT